MMKVSVAENRRIGVVALVPDKIQTKYVGIWAFSNQGEDAKVPEARLSQSVTAATVDALRANGFDAMPLGGNSAQWWAKYEKQRGSMLNFFTAATVGDTERRALGHELKAMAASQRLDAVALVMPGKPTGGGEANVGVGDYGFGTLTRDKEEVSVYAMTDLLVLGGQNLNTKALRQIRAVEPVQGVPFQARFHTYPADQQALLLQAMKDLFGRKVRESAAGIARP